MSTTLIIILSAFISISLAPTVSSIDYKENTISYVIFNIIGLATSINLLVFGIILIISFNSPEIGSEVTGNSQNPKGSILIAIVNYWPVILIFLGGILGLNFGIRLKEIKEIRYKES